MQLVDDAVERRRYGGAADYAVPRERHPRTMSAATVLGGGEQAPQRQANGVGAHLIRPLDRSAKNVDRQANDNPIFSS